MADDVLVGVLGGMGPAATAEFYRKLIAATPAGTDQDHLRVVIWADPSVPDRSAALLDGGADPRPGLVAGLRFLTDAGARLIAVPCNTAHAFLPLTADGDDRTATRLVDMIDETVRALARLDPVPTGVGLLATTGTIRSRLYGDRLVSAGMTPVVPDAAQQRAVMAAIRAAKAGRTGDDVREQIGRVAHDLVTRGADALVAACTEVPLLLGPSEVPVPLVDAAQALAEAVVVAAGRRPVGPTLSRCP